jgi:para-aminobenzoate synthetase component I
MRRETIPLAAFRQELPYRRLWPLAHALAQREPGVVFLDSSCEPELEGRWSVLGWRPQRTLRWPAGRPGALDGLRAMLSSRTMVPDPDSPAPFRGGFVGWIGYDIGRHIERLPERLPASPAMPDFAIAEYECLLVEDRLEKRLFLSGGCDQREGPSRLLARQSEAIDAFAALDDLPPPAAAAPTGPVAPGIPRAEYEQRVGRVLEYIGAGDIFQANLSQRFDAHLPGPPIELYRRLRAESPCPYGAWLDLGGPKVLSVSPELFLEKRGARIETRPIKGTRPRGGTPDEDRALVAELASCEKERAELAMIVDLLRNDLGRVAATGSVEVVRDRWLRAHPTVHHAVATVAARIAEGRDVVDLLAATLPGGSITGAPKIRAMEILEELEDSRRGPYCGSAGWIGYDGDLALNILIRTVVVEGERAWFRVGGGIVADSDPQAEYRETLDKARALLAALGSE